MCLKQRNPLRWTQFLMEKYWSITFRCCRRYWCVLWKSTRVRVAGHTRCKWQHLSSDSYTAMCSGITTNLMSNFVCYLKSRVLLPKTILLLILTHSQWMCTQNNLCKQSPIDCKQKGFTSFFSYFHLIKLSTYNNLYRYMHACSLVQFYYWISNW